MPVVQRRLSDPFPRLCFYHNKNSNPSKFPNRASRFQILKSEFYFLCGVAGCPEIVFKIREVFSYKKQKVFCQFDSVVVLERSFKCEQMRSQHFEGFNVRPGQIRVRGIKAVRRPGSDRLVIIILVTKRMRCRFQRLCENRLRQLAKV